MSKSSQEMGLEDKCFIKLSPEDSNLRWQRELDYLVARAKEGSWEKALEVLAKVPNVKPDSEDCLD
jgi:hypothetical protein